MDIHDIDKHFSQAFYLKVNAHEIHPVSRIYLSLYNLLAFWFLVICIDHQALRLKI